MVLTRRSFLARLWDRLRGRRATFFGVEFDVLRRSQSNRRYVWIHGDETTARDVLRDHMRGHAGVAYLVNGDQRNIPIHGGNIDPNRVFDSSGASRNLKRLNPGWKEEQLKSALDFLERDRPRLVRALTPPAGGILIAVHNNSRGYSVENELASSDQRSLKDASNPREFFLCSDERDFAILARGPYNVVWQSGKLGEDDGSMSRLAARQGFRYVNLEASLGKHARQAEMLLWLEDVLP